MIFYFWTVKLSRCELILVDKHFIFIIFLIAFLAYNYDDFQFRCIFSTHSRATSDWRVNKQKCNYFNLCTNFNGANEKTAFFPLSLLWFQRTVNRENSFMCIRSLVIPRCPSLPADSLSVMVIWRYFANA